MKHLSKERLEELAAGVSGFNLRIATHEESMEMARALLAGMTQEPVAQIEIVSGVLVNDRWMHNTLADGWHDLYSAPPAPVVPDAWIPCSQRMPDDDTYVVAADIGHGEIYSAFAAWFIHGRFSVMDGLSASNYDGGAMIEIDMPITHWQPLPAPPNEW